MKTLELIGLTETFEKTNESNDGEIYYNKKTNNMVIFMPYDEGITTEDIYNGIPNEPYTYLMSVLNNSTNIIVIWSKVEGTTSDYEIHYDCDTSYFLNLRTTAKSAVGYIHLESVEGKTSNYKYSQIKDGKISPVNFDAYKNTQDNHILEDMKEGEFKVLSVRFPSLETASVKYFLKLENGFAKGEILVPYEKGKAYEVLNRAEDLLIEMLHSSLKQF